MALEKLKEEVEILRRQLRDKVRELQALHRVTEAVSTLDLEELLKHLTEVVGDLTGADACLLYLYDESAKSLVLRASMIPHPKLVGKISLHLGEGITGWVAKERKVVAIPKGATEDPRFKFFQNLPEDRHEAFLSVPIVRKDRLIGVINVQHRKPHTHQPEEVTVVRAVAHEVGAAIENARLYEEMRRKARAIETLSKISGAIVSDKYLEEILHLIVTVTAELLSSRTVSIMLLDEARQELLIKATQSLSEEYRRKPNIKVGESVSGRAVKEKRPIQVLDVTQEKAYRYPEIAKQEHLCSLLSVPMMIKERVTGVINCYTDGEHVFSEEEVKILQSVAHQAAVSIENARLFDRAAAVEEALETRKSVERAKGILMKGRDLTEEEAFRLIQKQSMNTRKTMREIADAVILASEIKS